MAANPRTNPGFITELHFRNANLMMNEGKPLSCNFCHIDFPTAEGLTEHFNDHEVEGPPTEPSMDVNIVNGIRIYTGDRRGQACGRGIVVQKALQAAACVARASDVQGQPNAGPSTACFGLGSVDVFVSHNNGYVGLVRLCLDAASAVVTAANAVRTCIADECMDAAIRVLTDAEAIEMYQ